jgi:hypothetical protein
MFIYDESKHSAQGDKMSTIKTTTLRMPVELNKWLAHRAIDNGRSAHSEMLVILKEKMLEEKREEKQSA